ncbi:MAG: sodium ion-translocating decarboxylase subunit beta [Alloalcanivorax xenomutans]
MEALLSLWHSTGLYHLTWGQAVMIGVGLVLLYLAIRKNFEPLLLVPIGFGGILANIPVAGLAESAVSQALHFGDSALLAQMASALGVDPAAGVEALMRAYHQAAPALQAQLHHLATEANFSDGLL